MTNRRPDARPTAHAGLAFSRLDDPFRALTLASHLR